MGSLRQFLLRHGARLRLGLAARFGLSACARRLFLFPLRLRATFGRLCQRGFGRCALLRHRRGFPLHVRTPFRRRCRFRVGGNAQLRLFVRLPLGVKPLGMRLRRGLLRAHSRLRLFLQRAFRLDARLRETERAAFGCGEFGRARFGLAFGREPRRSDRRCLVFCARALRGRFVRAGRRFAPSRKFVQQGPLQLHALSGLRLGRSLGFAALQFARLGRLLHAHARFGLRRRFCLRQRSLLRQGQCCRRLLRALLCRQAQLAFGFVAPPRLGLGLAFQLRGFGLRLHRLGGVGARLRQGGLSRIFLFRRLGLGGTPFAQIAAFALSILKAIEQTAHVLPFAPPLSLARPIAYLISGAGFNVGSDRKEKESPSVRMRFWSSG